mgnify:CR=1 FL=1
MATTWMPIYGNVQVEEGVITFRPVPPPPEPSTNPAQPPHAFLRSNLQFDQGVIEWQTMVSDSSSSCQISLSTTAREDFFAGMHTLGAPFGFAKIVNGAWEEKGGVGHGTPLVPNQWYDLKLHVHGSNLDLYVNDVQMISTTSPITRGTVGLFMQGRHEIVVRNIRTVSTDPVCFVVMQFTPEYNSLYEEVIRPACERNGYKVVRADDFYHCGMIIDDVTKSIRESALIVVDVTPDNANVFYELGLAHGIGKDTILLCDRKREKLPFDISGFRTIFYENSIAGKRQVDERLEKHLINLNQQATARPTPIPKKI